MILFFFLSLLSVGINHTLTSLAPQSTVQKNINLSLLFLPDLQIYTKHRNENHPDLEALYLSLDDHLKSGTVSETLFCVGDLIDTYNKEEIHTLQKIFQRIQKIGFKNILFCSGNHDYTPIHVLNKNWSVFKKNIENQIDSCTKPTPSTNSHIAGHYKVFFGTAHQRDFATVDKIHQSLIQGQILLPDLLQQMENSSGPQETNQKIYSREEMALYFHGCPSPRFSHPLTNPLPLHTWAPYLPIIDQYKDTFFVQLNPEIFIASLRFGYTQKDIDLLKKVAEERREQFGIILTHAFVLPNDGEPVLYGEGNDKGVNYYKNHLKELDLRFDAICITGEFYPPCNEEPSLSPSETWKQLPRNTRLLLSGHTLGFASILRYNKGTAYLMNCINAQEILDPINGGVFVRIDLQGTPSEDICITQTTLSHLPPQQLQELLNSPNNTQDFGKIENFEVFKEPFLSKVYTQINSKQTSFQILLSNSH